MTSLLFACSVTERFAASQLQGEGTAGTDTEVSVAASQRGGSKIGTEGGGTTGSTTTSGGGVGDSAGSGLPLRAKLPVRHTAPPVDTTTHPALEGVPLVPPEEPPAAPSPAGPTDGSAEDLDRAGLLHAFPSHSSDVSGLLAASALGASPPSPTAASDAHPAQDQLLDAIRSAVERSGEHWRGIGDATLRSIASAVEGGGAVAEQQSAPLSPDSLRRMLAPLHLPGGLVDDSGGGQPAGEDASAGARPSESASVGESAGSTSEFHLRGAELRAALAEGRVSLSDAAVEALFHPSRYSEEAGAEGEFGDTSVFGSGFLRTWGSAQAEETAGDKKPAEGGGK